MGDDDGRAPVLPRYRDLPPGQTGAGSGWGLFGPDDQLGLINLQTPERVARAMTVARTGRMFALSAPLDEFDPPFFGHRRGPRHTVIRRSSQSMDDVLDSFFPQGSSQWDGLGHVGVADGVFYGGATAGEVIAGTRNSIDGWAARGIAGRGIVLDVSGAPALAAAGGAVPLAEKSPITVADLERAREQAGLRFEPGDILLLHTGFVDWYQTLAPAQREQLVAGGFRNAGLEQSAEMAEYLWDLHISALAADNVAVEAWPPDRSAAGRPFGFLHQVLIGEFGMALGELWALGGLARDCAADGVYECAVVSAPLRRPAGIGSPANAVAIK
jgi:kynurenine formamidase